MTRPVRKSAPRIAYFGGSFDPVHEGHLSIAAQVLERAELDELLFLPARVSPFKLAGRPTPGAHRVAMLTRALVDRPRMRIDPRELARPGASFTVDTMLEVRRERPEAELHFIIGRDHVASLPRWRRANHLAQLVTFLVVGRDGDPRDELARLPGNFRAHFVATEPHPASSTDIRRRLAADEDTQGLLPPAVASYARGFGLYDSARTEAT